VMLPIHRRVPPLRELPEILRVTFPHLPKFTGYGQRLEGVGADGFEHSDARFPVRGFGDGEEAGVGQVRDHIEGVAAVGWIVVGGGDGGYGIEVCAAGEDAEMAEEPLLICGEQVIGPSDGVAEGSLPVRGLVAVGGNVECGVQARQQCLRCEQTGAGGGQLDREREPVQADTYRGDVPGVVGGEGERRLDLAGMLNELVKFSV